MTADDLQNLEPPAARGSDAPRRAPRRLPGWLATLFANSPFLLLLLLPAAGVYLEGPWSIEDPRSEFNVDPSRLKVLLDIGIAIILAVSLHLINGISGQFSLGHVGFMAIGAYASAYATTTYSNNFTASPGVLLYFTSLAAILAIAAVGIAIIYFLIRSTARLARFLPGLLLFLLFIWITIDIAASPFRFDIGSAITGGQFHFDYSAVWPRLFQGLSWLFSQMLMFGGKPLTFLIVLIGGGLSAAIAGLIVGLPTIRLRGDYLAIVTLGFALIIRNVIELMPAVGASTGLTGIPSYAARMPEGDNLIRTHTIFPWIYGTAIVTIIVAWRLTRSPLGRAILATREDEIAARSVGIDTTRYKVLAFIVGAFFAGVAGGLFAHYTPARSISPQNFELERSIELVVIVTLGGLGRLWGAVLAATLLTFLPAFLQQPAFWIEWIIRPLRPEGAPAPQFPGSINQIFAWMNEQRMIIYSLLLIFIMLARGRNYLGWLPWSRKQQR